jgi:hypothetical protein
MRYGMTEMECNEAWESGFQDGSSTANGVEHQRPLRPETSDR